MDSFHEHFDPLFVLAVHLTADTALRVVRVHARAQALLGAGILSGGELYERHQRFLADVASYEAGGGSMSLERHRQWAASLACPVRLLDGGEELATLTVRPSLPQSLCARRSGTSVHNKKGLRSPSSASEALG